MLSDGEMDLLAQDIKANGLKYPITLCDGKILDGRNRYKACHIAGVDPEFIDYHGNNPLQHVISLNLNRRHLNESQRAVVAERLATMNLGDNQHKSGCTNLDTHLNANLQKITDDEFDKKVKLPSNYDWNSNPKNSHGVSLQQAASLLNVSRSNVANVREIKAKAPERIAEIESGAKTVHQVQVEIKKEEVVERNKTITNFKTDDLIGEYDVVVLDPPWPMQKIEREVRPNQVGFDYPTMEEDELNDLKIPMADNCHVWVWTTHKFLPMALRLIEKWGMRYVCTFVWHKPGGFQPIGLPQYNCEFALYARRGTPKFIDTKAFNTCFNASRGSHSEKPEEFYELIRRVTSGRRVDMFNRRRIEGFDTWGKEADNG